MGVLVLKGTMLDATPMRNVILSLNTSCQNDQELQSFNVLSALTPPKALINLKNSLKFIKIVFSQRIGI